MTISREGKTSAAVFALIAGVVICATVLIPVGFRGADDFQYLIAAERWLHEGVNVGVNHWANRLPYVWGWAASFALFGKTELALQIFHGSLLTVIAFLAWLIGQSELHDRRAALIGMLSVLFTPIIFRFSTFYYPEVIEIPALAACVLIVLNIDRWQSRRQSLMLLIAGLLGGVAIIVRQTAIALPVSLALTMFFFGGTQRIDERIKAISILAVGFLSPLIVEFFYYWVMTGNPLHRFAVDTAHAKISGAIMKGGAFNQYESALFNWKLGHEWNRETIVPTYWFLAPLVRLFASPGVLLLPWLAVVGGVIAWRTDGRARRFAFLTLSAISTQYLLNTFVLVTAPNNRYFGVGLLLMGPLAGLAIARLLRKPYDVIVVILVWVVPACLMGLLQPRPSERATAIDEYAQAAGEPISLNAQGQRLLALRFRNDETLAQKLPEGPAPVGGLLAVWPANPDPQVPTLCASGSPALEKVATLRADSPIKRGLSSIGFYNSLPPRVRSVIARESEETLIYRRLC